MDYEKKYNEALKRAKAAIDIAADKDLVKGVATTIFPELRESEDEKFRKYILRGCKECVEANDRGLELSMDTTKKLLTYLEKHKEDKDELVYRLNGMMQDYIKEGKDDEEKEHRLKCYQLFWDALEDTNFFEQKEQKHPDGCFTCDEYKKGYETGRLNGFTAGYNKAMKEQKSVEPSGKLSRQEHLYQLLIDQLITYSDYQYLIGQKPAWSEEDENAITTSIHACRYMTENFENSTKQYEDAIERLKSLRPQPKQEWSEEDEEMITNIISSLRGYMCVISGSKNYNNHEAYIQKEIEFLNALRPSWKPSEHQMNILKAVKEYVGRGSEYWGETLGSLIEDLEKLM